MFCMMRRATALVLTISCGILFAFWFLMLTCLITGRGSFGGGGLPIEYICFSVIGLFSGFGFYAGVRALLAHFANRPPATDSTKQTDTNRLARVIGWIMVSFGALAVYTLAEARTQTTTFDGLMFIVYGAVFCLVVGGGLSICVSQTSTVMAR